MKSTIWNTLCHLFLLHQLLSVHTKDISNKHKSYYSKHRHESYYESNVVREDIERDVYLGRHQIQKLFFILEGGYRPISVTVTPCSTDATLEWKISHSSSNVASYHAGTWSNHVIRPPSLSPSATYVGRERRSYTNPRAPPGLYTLEFRTDIESRAKVLLTTRPTTQMPYHPPLPPESAVQIVKIKRNRILISWKASLTGRDVEYCVSSNNRGNYNSLCSATRDVYASQAFKPPSKSYHHSPLIHEYQKNHVSLSCVGRKTWHLFKNLQRGRTYYFDVFVLDTENNASSTYTGVSATVRNVAGHPARLKDDSLMTFALDSSNGYSITTKYHSGKFAAPTLLFIQSCTGPGPVTLQITQNSVPKHEVLSTNVMDVKTLEVPQQVTAPANGSNIYAFSIRSTTKHNRKVRVWISGKKNSFPFPVLPQDKSVRVFDTLTTCDSITIGWKTSPDEKVKYCIYRQAAFDELMQRTLTEPQNFCEQTPNGNSVRVTVLCRRYHKFSKRRFNNVIMQRVKGLHPGATYLFEVQVTKVKGKMLPYEQVWATTHENCSNTRPKR